MSTERNWECYVIKLTPAQKRGLEELLGIELHTMSNPYKVGDKVKLLTALKDGYGEIWHEKGKVVEVKKIAPDGEGLMFTYDIGAHWSNVIPAT